MYVLTFDSRRTAVSSSAAQGIDDVMISLLNASTDINKCSVLSRTPLCRAAIGRNLESVQLLKSAGVDID